MYSALLASGIIFLAVGWLLIYRRKTIIQINEFVRKTLLNDALIIASHKKIGIFFLILSLIFLSLSVLIKK